MKNVELDRKVKADILANIDGSNYGVEPETEEEKVRFLAETFHAEYGWRVQQAGELVALTDYLQGLPSSINIAFYNGDILDIAREWGSLPEDATEAQEQKILDNWWNLLANKILQLFRKYEV